MKTKNASDLFFSIEENQILCSRGDFVLAYKIDYPEKYSQSEYDFETIHTGWVRAFRTLPIGTIIVKSDVYIKDKFDVSGMPNDTFLQNSTKEYFRDREYFEHTGYIFFIFTKVNTLKNETIKNPFILPDLKSYEQEDIEIKNFINDVEQSIQIIGKDRLITLMPLEEREVTEFRDFYFNGFQTDYFTDLEIEKEYIRSDNQYAYIFAINNEKNFPDHVSPAIEDPNFSNREKDFYFYQGYLDSLGLTLGCSHIYNQILFLDEHNYHLNKINTNLKNLKGARRLSPENEIGAKRLEEYIAETIDDPNSRYTRGMNNVIFWSSDLAELEYNKKKISAILKGQDFKPTFLTRERLKNVFYNSFFANTSCLNNENLYMVDIRIAVCLFITNSNYKNDAQGIYLNDRIFNIPVKYDLWDADRKRKKSRNLALIAPTGSGKSFTWQHISYQFYSDPDELIQCLIDLGDSYLKLSKILPEKDVAHYKYEEGKPLGLNPFGLLPGESPTSFKIEEVAEFVWTLIKKQNEPTENERTSLRHIIQHYYITEEDHSWPNFYKFVRLNRKTILELSGLEAERIDFFNISEFLHAGKDFIDDGNYAFLFRDNTDRSSEFVGKKLIIFELDQVKDNKLLLAIMLQVISEAIYKTIWSDKTKRGIVFYDEFAKQLEFPEILQRVKYQTQAIRKYNGAAGIVLQSINQLPDTPEGRSILDNIETFIFLQGSDYRIAEQRLGLSRHDVSQLNSLASNFTGPTPWSEVYIKTQRHGNVYRIETSKEVYLAFQTEGRIHEELLKITENNGGDMIAAIKEYLPKIQD